MSEAVLSLRGATKRFGGLVAVDNIDFDVRAGQVLGLIGPNGSGKSTTLNLISGMLPPTSGEISLHGAAITGLRADKIAKRGISRTFQLVRLLPSMSVEQNMIAGATSASISSPTSIPSASSSPAPSLEIQRFCCSMNGSQG